MLPLRAAWCSTRRSASASAKQPNLDLFISNLAKTHVTERSVKGLVEVEKLIDEKKATSIDRLTYLTMLPTLLNKQQLNRIREDSFAADFESTAFNKDELVAAVDKMCKLRATDTQTYRTLMSVLSSVPPSSLRNVSMCALVEIVSTNEELKAIDNEEWRNESKNVVAELIKQSNIPTELIYALRKTKLWYDECIQTIKDNFKMMNFVDKVSLLNSLTERGDADRLFINTMVEEIASDSTPLTFRQCINLASTCRALKLTSSRLQTKLIKETMAAMGGMRKWSDARAIVTLLTIWRVTDDAVWKQLSMWTERGAKDAQFKDAASVVNMMGDLGREEGAATAAILSGRMCMERGGDPLIWLKTMVSLSFYSTIDHRSIESVLNTVFVQEVLAHSGPEKRSLVLRMLMQVDYYASTLDSYSGPRLKEGLITHDDRSSILSAYYSRQSEVDAFRSCLSRIIVDPANCRAQVHDSGLTLEARFNNRQGGEEVVVFVPTDRCAKAVDGERMMGSNLLSLNCMRKKGIKVHSFTHREMESFSSQVEATTYIKKKILGK